MDRLRLSVIAIGGSHQILHFIPLVLKLADRGRISPEIFVAKAAEREVIARLAARLSLPLPTVTVVTVGGSPGLIFRSKSMRIMAWSRRLRDADVLLSAERTSTILTRLPGRKPPFVHIPHGAGDRAKGFEPRIALFDRILVSGEKDRDRIVAAGLQPPSAVDAIGSVKLATLALMPRPRHPFDNNLPTVLYNPHFSETLGTFDKVAGRLIDGVASDPRYNLIVAPHVRLAETLSREQRQGWESRAGDRIIVDFGSERSIDTTYTRCADLYVGDVSSQVYEAIAPARKPCLFVNRAAQGWADDADFAMWKFGPVIDADAPIMPAVEDALARLPEFRAAQDAAIARAYAPGSCEASALDTMAERVEAIMLELAASGRSARSRSRYR